MLEAGNLYANKKIAVIDGLIVLAFAGILSYTNHSLSTSTASSPSASSPIMNTKLEIKAYSNTIKPNWNGSTAHPILVKPNDSLTSSIVSHYY